MFGEAGVYSMHACASIVFVQISRHFEFLGLSNVF